MREVNGRVRRDWSGWGWTGVGTGRGCAVHKKIFFKGRVTGASTLQQTLSSHSHPLHKPTLPLQHAYTPCSYTSSSAVAERPRNALYLSVVSLNKIITRAESLILLRRLQIYRKSEAFITTA